MALLASQARFGARVGSPSNTYNSRAARNSSIRAAGAAVSAARLPAPLRRQCKVVAFLEKEKAASAASTRQGRPMPSIRDLAILTNLTYQDDVEVTKKGAPPGWELVTRATRDQDYGLSVDLWQNDELMVNFATIRGTHERVTWLANAGLGSDQTPSWFYVIRDQIPDMLNLGDIESAATEGQAPRAAAPAAAVSTPRSALPQPAGNLLEGVLAVAKKKTAGRKARPAAATKRSVAKPPTADSPRGQEAEPEDAAEEPYQLILGGHSLGACVAELLAVDQDIPAVTWESPGIGGMSVMVRSSRSNKDESAMRAARAQNRIVSFLSGPNMVNTGNPHPCPVYRLYIPYVKPDGQEKASWYAMAASAGRVGLMASIPLAFFGSFAAGIELASACAMLTLGSAFMLQKDVTVVQHDMDALTYVCNPPGRGYTVKGYDPKNPEAAGVDSSQLCVKMKDWPKKLPSLTAQGFVQSIVGLLLPFGKHNLSALNASRPNDIFEEYNTSMPGYEVEAIIKGPDAQKTVEEALLNACTWKYQA